MGKHNYQTVGDALAAHGVNRDIQKVPVYYESPRERGCYRRIDDRYAVIDAESDHAYGVVGKAYKPVSAGEAFGFLDALIEEGVLDLHEVKELSDGRETVLLTELHDHFGSVGSEEVIYGLIFCNSYSGRSGVTVTPTVSVGDIIVPRLMGKRLWTVTHKRNVRANLDVAGEAVEEAITAMDEYVQWYDGLAGEYIEDSSARKFFRALVGPGGDGPRGRGHRNSQSALLWENYESDNAYGTAFGLLRAVARTELHKRLDREEPRLRRLISGNLPMCRQATGLLNRAFG